MYIYIYIYIYIYTSFYKFGCLQKTLQTVPEVMKEKQVSQGKSI